jgi:hypothetical protein
MKPLPQLNRHQLNEWREKILGEQSKKFPDSFLFEQLFFERSPLSKGKLLSERVEILINKYPQPDTYEGLLRMYPEILKFLKENEFLDETAYEKENEKCASLVLSK